MVKKSNDEDRKVIAQKISELYGERIEKFNLPGHTKVRKLYKASNSGDIFCIQSGRETFHNFKKDMLVALSEIKEKTYFVIGKQNDERSKTDVYVAPMREIIENVEAFGNEDKNGQIKFDLIIEGDEAYLSKLPQLKLGKKITYTSGNFDEKNSSKDLSILRDQPEDQTISSKTSHFDDEVFLENKLFCEYVQILKDRKNIILQGPPGVGKSFLAKKIAFAAMGEKRLESLSMVQFHQSYGYEEFIRGWRPNKNGGFELVDGAFLNFCKKARADLKNDYFFIIDEINRGNLTRIFGEVMLLIENDKRNQNYALTLANNSKPEEPFFITPNVHIIGMMNTADRSLAMVDYALRRRFYFFDIEPAFPQTKFKQWLIKNGCEEKLANKIINKMKEINQEIEKDKTNLGHGYRIGHSYFCPLPEEIPNNAWYSKIIRYEIKPLLREYWFDKPEKVDEMIEFLLK